MIASVPQKKPDSSRVSYQMQMDDERVQKREAKKLAKQHVYMAKHFSVFIMFIQLLLFDMKE